MSSGQYTLRTDFEDCPWAVDAIYAELEAMPNLLPDYPRRSGTEIVTSVGVVYPERREDVKDAILAAIVRGHDKAEAERSAPSAPKKRGKAT